MQISYRQSLRSFNTFGVDVRAYLLCKAGTHDDLKKILTFAKRKALKVLFLGGGSNILLARDFDGVVILLEGFIDIEQRSRGTHRWVRCKGSSRWRAYLARLGLHPFRTSAPMERRLQTAWSVLRYSID